MVKTVELGPVTSDWLAWELDGNHQPSRENKDIAVSQTLVDGSVVSENTDGEIQLYAAATDEVAIGIYIGKPITTTSSDTEKGVIVARDARIVEENITFKSGLTDTQKAAAMADLAKLSITPVRLA